jgi:flagellar biosynthesis protein FlhB
MLSKIIGNIKHAAWFIQSGVAPKNAEPHQLSKLKDINHMASKKFAMTMVAVGVIAFMYFSSLFFLFFFNSDPHVSAIVSMYKDMIVAVASIVATLVGVQGLVDWKYDSASTSSNLSETRNENINETLTSNAKEDDYTTTIS